LRRAAARFPADSRSNDLWFQHIAIIVSDMDQAYQVLRENRVEHASTGPQRLPDWNKNAAGIKAFYFKDPDEHPVEILEFPENKGAAKWHKPNGRVFLGIDHTAIAVSNTESSLKFYRDVLGMRVPGKVKITAPNRNISTTSLAPFADHRVASRCRARDRISGISDAS
jgi:Lactoylglutathione lyase and related lyases